MANKTDAAKPYHVYVAWIGSSDPPLARTRPVLPAADLLWPGLPYAEPDGVRRVDTGPNLAALFHPNSPLYKADRPDRVFLLFDNERFKDQFDAALKAVAAARKSVPPPAKWVVYVDLCGAISDPSNHKQILDALNEWVAHELPFNRPTGWRGDKMTRITVHLDPGTPAAAMCWLLARWKGLFKDPPAHDVRFLQGDGGRFQLEELRQPYSEFPFSELSRYTLIPENRPAPRDIPAELDYATLKSGLYTAMRQEIEKAAMLGIPVLLVGDRGTGKTALARFYHEQRTLYLERRGGGQTRRQFVKVTLSEFPDQEAITLQLFGWRGGVATDVTDDFDGSIGAANGGTLFLDEIHHLDKPLQATMLSPLNDGKYRRKGDTEERTSHFSLVVATNDRAWRDKLAADFCDRIERVVLAVPSFTDLQRVKGFDDLRQIWAVSFRQRCDACGVYSPDPPADCRDLLDAVFCHRQLAGNWRDFHRLADHILMALTDARNGQPTGVVIESGLRLELEWDRDRLEVAIDRAFPRR